MPIQAAIFDGDDTLWRTEILYDRARDAARQIVSEYGLNPDQWERRQRAIDIANVAVYGFSSDRFPTSCLQAFEEVESESGAKVHEDVRGRLIHAAKSVFRNRPKLVPYAASVLHELQKRRVRLALLTKGDPTVQKDRVEKSGLASFFELIEIVPEKTPSAIKDVLQK
jgi:putative hydrolase of the HAD superfamily